MILFSYMRIRFRANNPGVWLFHCHTESHLDRGMAVMIHVSYQFKKTVNLRISHLRLIFRLLKIVLKNYRIQDVLTRQLTFHLWCSHHFYSI